jgi:hypothetical protein
LAAPLHHVFEQKEFTWQQIDSSVAAPCGSIDEIELQRSNPKHGLGRLERLPSQGSDPRQQFGDGGWRCSRIVALRSRPLHLIEDHLKRAQQLWVNVRLVELILHCRVPFPLDRIGPLRRCGADTPRHDGVTISRLIERLLDGFDMVGRLLLISRQACPRSTAAEPPRAWLFSKSPDQSPPERQQLNAGAISPLERKI